MSAMRLCFLSIVAPLTVSLLLARAEAWHFINIPYVRDPMFSGLNAVANESSVGWAINQMKSVLTSDTAATEDKARALRFLIHFVGDSHQPCHAGTCSACRPPTLATDRLGLAATMYKQNQFNPPEGDRGCNLYKISGTPSQTNTTNLHLYAAARSKHDDLRSPHTAGSCAWLCAIASLTVGRGSGRP